MKDAQSTSRQTALYRCYNDETPVYVGISKNLMRRLPEHERKFFTSVEVEYYSKRADAMAEEARLIKAYKPVYNLTQAARSRSRPLQVRGVAAEIIKTARKKAGLTQTELAERLGRQQQTVSAYEGGRKEPTLVTLLMILEAAGFEPRFHLVPIGSDPLSSS